MFDVIVLEVSKNTTARQILPPRTFEARDFVLIRRVQDKSHKLTLKWQGPQRFTKIINPLVYEVASLVSKKSENVHAARIILYRSDLDGKVVSKELVPNVLHTETHYEDIHALRELKKNGSEYLVRVEWEGLPDQIDHTWESIKNLNEDVPEMLREFLAGLKGLPSKGALL